MFDIEDCLDAVETILTTKLNAKIVSVEADKIAKSKGLTGGLPSIASGAFYRQAWSDEILNNSPAILFGVAEIAAEGIGPASVKKIKIFIDCIILDNGMDSDTHKRVLRYTRAIEDTMHSSFDSLTFASKIKLEAYAPASFRLDTDNQEEIKIGGVLLTLNIA